jgi:hypothetical protein
MKIFPVGRIDAFPLKLGCETFRRVTTETVPAGLWDAGKTVKRLVVPGRFQHFVFIRMTLPAFLEVAVIRFGFSLRRKPGLVEKNCGCRQQAGKRQG